MGCLKGRPIFAVWTNNDGVLHKMILIVSKEMGRVTGQKMSEVSTFGAEAQVGSACTENLAPRRPMIVALHGKE